MIFYPIGYLTICILTLNLTPISGGIQERRLLSEKLVSYNPLERPVFNESQSLDLHLNLSLQQIVDLDEKNQILTSNIWLNIDWEDYSMLWNSTEYNGVEDVRIDPSLLWKPDLFLYNSASESFDATFPVNMVVSSNGRISQIPPGIFKSTCLVDITWFPFDEQNCFLRFGTWTHMRDRINLVLSSGDEKGHADLSQFKENGEWFLVGVPAVRTVLKYPCCVGEYTEVYFHIIIRRRTIYYFHNLIFPCILIASMAVFGFTTPPPCGEKLTLGITILMSLTFYMNMVSEMQPPSSETPILGVYFSCIMATVASSVVSTIAILNFHDRDQDNYEMSKWIRLVFIKWLPWCLRMERPGTKHLPLKAMTLKSKLKKLEKADRCPMSLVPTVLDRKEEFIAGALANSNLPLQNERINCITSIYGSLDDTLDSSTLSLPTSTSTASANNKQVPPKQSETIKDLEKILVEVQSITMKIKEEEESKLTTTDWKYAAMVLDRVCLVVFTSTTLLLSLAVVVAVPRVFVF
ncbi:acetylcholine receptor subunit alpha-type acr-16 [Eurytemora carolleeae]|uniref:acetylcholine receptor subunit alpha-type acr-16 n=1 Tax=Eurytemora carolleeae TaxID=1294199 RepID=UPI000C772B06|nr:acetylcholine receptor subunit alpha-type acr-16 [Eurytemora carolleeae]|eukprot:XP_023333751.1 acetylcholine receptor subunit alpha-type acr-16-like [Eurytemora affinis]